MAPFSFLDAMGVWDRAHVAALVAWMGSPGAVKPSILDGPERRDELRALHGDEKVTERTEKDTLSGEKWLVAGWRLEMQQQAERSSRWPKDRTLAMFVLARSFPPLAGAPGLEPWNVDAFLPWLCSPEREAAAVHAGCFLLAVWNPGTNWKDVAAELGLSQCTGARPFNLMGGGGELGHRAPRRSGCVDGLALLALTHSSPSHAASPREGATERPRHQ